MSTSIKLKAKNKEKPTFNVIFNQVLYLVQEKHTISEACKKIKISRTYLYRRMSVLQKQELSCYKAIHHYNIYRLF